MEKAIKAVDDERRAWAELDRRLTFFIELSNGSVNKGLAKDAAVAFNAAADSYFPAYDLRMAAELGGKA